MSIEGLSNHLMSDILSRLDVKTLVKCKAVKKLWKSLIEDTLFVSVLHFNRSSLGSFDPQPYDDYVTTILDSFCGLVWSSYSAGNFPHFLHNPAIGKALYLQDPMKGHLGTGTGRIAFNRATHECKLQYMYNDWDLLTLQTFEVGKDIEWQCIGSGRQRGILDVPEEVIIKICPEKFKGSFRRSLSFHVLSVQRSPKVDLDDKELKVFRRRKFEIRCSGVIHYIDVFSEEYKETKRNRVTLLVISNNIWDDIHIFNYGFPNGTSFDLMKAEFFECDDCLAISEIIGEDLHFLKMTQYDGGDLRWSERKTIVALTFLCTEPYLAEKDGVLPILCQSTPPLLWFSFNRGRPFSYDVQALSIEKFGPPQPKREYFHEVNRIRRMIYIPSLVNLQGMREDRRLTHDRWQEMVNWYDAVDNEDDEDAELLRMRRNDADEDAGFLKYWKDFDGR
ncbi:uncharacterized protein LOC133033533 [Cannabis sativa]|uniref:F-box domain-containing protein n=1 Tax=Cannabis sativa TaxID=3483 RepID=A0A7J6HRY0_CANSA|nr:uncharacterized protein LOC133033533 [Cannabis sativa]XP_060964340.1 uncharacterized protein LOC133033533 [Cannabis sativa]KAF4350894.1 hypothetical protein F8388_008076 [Cannabis sativa]KAF4398032.1 hypothetical protein G4B88_019753 [Cannabis sativa]